MKLRNLLFWKGKSVTSLSWVHTTTVDIKKNQFSNVYSWILKVKVCNSIMQVFMFKFGVTFIMLFDIFFNFFYPSYEGFSVWFGNTPLFSARFCVYKKQKRSIKDQRNFCSNAFLKVFANSGDVHTMMLTLLLRAEWFNFLHSLNWRSSFFLQTFFDVCTISNVQ